MSEWLILAAAFVAVTMISMIVVNFVLSRRQVSSRLDADETTEPMTTAVATGNDLSTSESNRLAVEHYFGVVRTDNNPNSLANRLIRAEYFSPNARWVFQFTQAVIAVTVFVGVYIFLDIMVVSFGTPIIIVFSTMFGALAFFLCSIILERIGNARQRSYQRLFPDFIDMLIVCVDAGLSIEAAADRVAREFTASGSAFGLHLNIMMLEVRGGRRLRDALTNLAERLDIGEARSVAVLFRQSEELGSSVTKSLRVYADEMRRIRIIRAEERANALPVKMLIPMSLFLFPVSATIVLVPIAITVIQLLANIGAPPDL